MNTMYIDSQIAGILKLIENKQNRKCAFNEFLAYHDGKEI